MKNSFRFWLSLGLSMWGSWAWSAENSPEGRGAENVSAEILLSDEDLDKLTGPIALYPDVLVALILPASTEAADVVLAARFFAQGGKDSDVDAQRWDESVRALARYPEVIQWMDENLAWTQQLGAAFLAQPADVMKSVQRMRARAREAGNLVSTQEQTVLVESDYIRIVPTQPEVIYVPRYNPAVVYVPVSAYYGPVVAYGLPYRSGSWLRYDCNWWSWSIWMGSWNVVYYRQPAWRPPHHGPRPPHVAPPHNTWRPPPGKRPPHHVMPPRHHDRWVARPVPMPGAPDRGIQPGRPGDRGGGMRPGHWDRPGSGNHQNRPGNVNPGNKGGNNPPILRPGPRPGEMGNRPIPENPKNTTPAPRPAPPTARPEGGGRENRLAPNNQAQNWRGSGYRSRHHEDGITPPSTSAPSVRPSPERREPRDMSSDMRRRDFASPDAKRGATPPSQSVRPGRGEVNMSAGSERRSRRESSSAPALSSPAPSAQRPPHPAPPRRQFSPPPAPSSTGADNAQKVEGAGLTRPDSGNRERGRR